MKKFTLKLAAFALALAVPLGAFFGAVQSLPPVYAGSLMGSIRVKLATLDETEGPRLVLVGGSNLPYAVICGEVSDAFGMPCVNLGATAYLGMDFYLAEVENRLRAGDIVVLAPEFSMYRDIYSYTTVWMAIEDDAGLLRDLPAGYLPGMAANFYNYAKEKTNMIKAHGRPRETALEQYRQFGFGPWGDITIQRGRELTLEDSVGGGTAVEPGMIEDNVLHAMNRFYKKMRKKGVAVYLTWAPYCRQAVTSGEEDILAFEERVRDECDIPCIGELADGLMDIEYFYDSNNHLNSEGMALRTALLIEDLRAAGAGG